MWNQKLFRRSILILSVVLFFIVFSGQVFALESSGGKWVLVETLVNPRGEETNFVGGGATPLWFTGARYEGKTLTYTVSETSITIADHHMDHGKEYYNVKYIASFSKPPSIMREGEKITLPATVSGSGSVTEVRGSGNLFEYRTEGVSLQGNTQQGINLTFEGGTINPYFIVPKPWEGGKLKIMAFFWNSGACYVEWVYKAEVAETVETTSTTSTAATTAATTTTTTAATTTTNENEETEQEKMERAIAQNLVEYLAIKNKFLEDLKDLQDEAYYILKQIRNAEWDLKYGTDIDKEQAEKDLERLRAEQKEKLKEFESRSAKFYDILERMEGAFLDYEHRDDYEDYIKSLRGELDMTHLNLALRIGDMEEFNRIFPKVNDNPHVRTQALTANAFRQQMEGDTRTALHSARLILKEEPDNPIAPLLIRDIELAYLDRIRDQLALEQSNTARLLNDKLNGHGEQGKGNLLIDIATIGVGESFSAIAGYYDTLGDLQDIQVDEASRQIAGICLIENLRERGVTFDEMNQLSIDEMKKLAREEYERELTYEQAQSLRQRIWDGFRNDDVNAIRSGDLSQYNIDVGRDYFDSEVLQFNEADLVGRQFSAWDTFLTFAPSAHLGRLGETGLAGRLGLTAQSTFQQGLQSAFRVEQLGQSIYQTRSGAAIIDGLHQLNGYETMVANAIKNQVGENVYAAGSIAVRQYISQMTGPTKKKMQEEILRISDHFIGSENTGAIEGTLNAMNGVFNFIGLNQQALMRGAYGIERMERLENVITRERTMESNVAKNNMGVARAGNRPRNFNRFQENVGGNKDYLEEVRDARSKVQSITQDNNPRRRSLLSQADQTLQHEQHAAQLIQQGDAGARQAFDQMMQSQNQLSQIQGQSLRRIGELNNMLTSINEFRATPSGNRDFAGAMAGYVLGQAAAQSTDKGTQVTSYRNLPDISQSALGVPK